MKGGNVIKGYLNRAEATAETIQDGWLRTGDIARIDEEGFIYIVDRAKDMVLRGAKTSTAPKLKARFSNMTRSLNAPCSALPMTGWAKRSALPLSLPKGHP